ncbi:hypothetical protein AGMMS49579_07440 [Spirochaetia bacterium]|nr:hypothetical protein AGMMS49579_07440 [Spirochaetia bacterium]
MNTGLRKAPNIPRAGAYLYEIGCNHSTSSDPDPAYVLVDPTNTDIKAKFGVSTAQPAFRPVLMNLG